MNKLVIAVLLILAGFSLGAFTPPDSGVSADEEVSAINFTNGWSIVCSGTNLVFTTP